jgi:hypothetical protein
LGKSLVRALRGFLGVLEAALGALTQETEPHWARTFLGLLFVLGKYSKTVQADGRFTDADGEDSDSNVERVLKHYIMDVCIRKT